MQVVSPGRLEVVCRRELERMIAVRAVEKLWDRRADLWTSDPEQARIIASRLGWLGVPEAMRPQSEDLAGFARAIPQEGFRDVVLLGIGGSSLAAEVFALTFPMSAGARRFFILDTTDPETIRVTSIPPGSYSRAGREQEFI